MKIQKTYGIYLFAISLFWALWLQLTAGPSNPHPKAKVETWFLRANETLTLPEFKTIDTRSFPSRVKEKLPNSIVLNWEDLSQKETPNRGKLLETKTLHKKLSSLGLESSDIIIVLGDGKNGWGEEGRIVWSLREIGYPKTFWFDGDVSNFKEVINQRKDKMVSQDKTNHSYLLAQKEIQFHTDITKDQISKQLSQGSYQILDTREPREFSGSTPYGEFRGGHIPGAKSFFYQNLFDDHAKIKTKEEVENSLTQLGITKSKPIIAYCTGGVRSAFVVGILRSYGYNAYNYSGSMWEWSSYKDLPLEK
ncbi:thiosulfate sulfurtransferase [Leptospira levettii]|uniref:sulfurtransferase n=1 Tax=Leptospira levettii TaxID=2023178 RepID=UPI0010845E6F|nr:rhodanese-like domain-containing protein [Leptospira levettii]TGK93305.1 thiosulfate sulfurtransferase [Leptospira levettii]TGM66194.1 thiosulfate sulfurtransferase [Leptospira levettii]